MDKGTDAVDVSILLPLKSQYRNSRLQCKLYLMEILSFFMSSDQVFGMGRVIL